MNVADTLITPYPAEARHFIAEHPQAIAKPNYSARFHKDGKDYVFYTSHIDASTDFSGLCVAPAILQQAIKVKTELRVTVVGGKVFAAATERTPELDTPHVRDWRAPGLNGETTTFVPHELSPKLSKQCAAVVRELGLQYGALDLIVDTRGKVWFLENNPMGQWVFIENATGLPIAKAIAEQLMRGGRPKKGAHERRSHTSTTVAVD